MMMMMMMMMMTMTMMNEDDDDDDDDDDDLKTCNLLNPCPVAKENIAFGSGGALLQKLNRDTFKCAFK